LTRAIYQEIRRRDNATRTPDENLSDDPKDAVDPDDPRFKPLDA
jgi:hypothetical protein